MSKENDILIRVRNFMKYWHPEIPRQLPEAARVEYNSLHAAIDAHLAPAEKPVAKKAAKKKAAKKVSKKK